MKNADKVPVTFRQAEALLDARPLPLNIVEQLDELRRKTPMAWRKYFDDFYEGAIASANSVEPFE